MSPDHDVQRFACQSCGADWSAGEFDAECAECGGGALERQCGFCDGVCGAVWKRRVIDSWDEAEAQWIGGCAANCSSCGARWGVMAHGPGCAECGGGSLIRPCPECDGACGMRERDVAASWQHHVAHWRATCNQPTS